MKKLLQRLTKGKRGLKYWLTLGLHLVLALASLGCLLGMRSLGGTLEALTAAERFRGDGELRFAQLACFLPADGGKSEADIYSFRQTLDSKMVEQFLEAPEGGSLYLDAYCGTASVNVVSEGGSATAEAIGVGGDFFYFHPLHLRSGSYISGGDLMDDLVVLDEEVAWKLFGGTELTGMSLTINGQPFIVAGVVSREDDFASRRAYSGTGGIFLSYSALSRLEEDASITCYEVVMPDPISGYAKGVLTDSFPGDNKDVVENSSRYSPVRLFTEVAGQFGERSMRTNGIIYPYWENAARLTEDYAALLLILAILFALCPVLSALVWSILSIRRGYRFLKRTVPEKVEAGVEKRRERRLEKNFEKEGKTNHGGAEPAESEEGVRQHGGGGAGL